MEDYELEKSIYGWTMKIGNKSYYDVPEDFALIITQLEKENERLSVELNTCMIERNNYLSKNDKAIEWINSHIETYTKNGISIIDWDTLSDPRKLLKILGGDNNDKS